MSKYRTAQIVITIILLPLCLGLGGCSTYRSFIGKLMSAPSIYYATGLDPYTENIPVSEDLTLNILYATDRACATANDEQRFYSNHRGHILRLGEAKVKFDKSGASWADLRQYSLLKERTDALPIKVSDVTEYGPLSLEIPRVMKEYSEEKAAVATREFADRINARLKETSRKDIYIYVHGYKVEFENPIIVAAELWHYLGYHGVMLAYAWPSTPRTLAYSGDLETAQYSSQNLRYLLQFLARETTAERIHIVAYSAGTRVAVDAVRDLGLIYSHESQEKIFEELKIEDLILLGSDMDRHIIRSYARDGMLDVARHLSIYASKKDGAMTMSKFVFGYYRIGDLRNNDQLTTETVEYMRRHPSAIIIDVTCAENAKKGSGHGYFLASPWVSSDIFITLLRGLPPQDRGLIQGKDDAIWSFPSDYEERLKALAREAKQKKDRDGTRAGLNK